MRTPAASPGATAKEAAAAANACWRWRGCTGWDCDCVKGGWSELMDAVASGKIDVMGAVSHTLERAQAIAL